MAVSHAADDDIRERLGIVEPMGGEGIGQMGTAALRANGSRTA
jgi:hypothetical protein